MKSLIQKLAPIVTVGLGIVFTCGSLASAQEGDRLTPIQQRIQVEQRRLSSSSVEDRRDALMKLGAMNHPDASRVAMSALNDSDPVVRVTAAHAMAALPASDASAALVPLLTDKQEFVRREAVNALGKTGGHAAVQPLIQLLSTDKEPSVRAAAAIALGKIKDDAAVVPLANLLTGSATGKKSKTRENEFVRRSAARALGEIRSRAGVAALVASLSDDQNEIEVRRAAAEALGNIGDASAAPALKTASESTDPYLSRAARTALRSLQRRSD